MGFLTDSEVRMEDPATSRVARCGKCGLLDSCKSPKMKVSGRGKKKILIVGKAPGEDEDREGESFVGRDGRRLRDELDKLGCDFDKDCWRTYACICCPLTKVENKHVEACRPNLNKTIAELKPETIVLLGGSAIQSVIGQEWLGKIGPTDRWVGWTIPSQKLNAWICPTWDISLLHRRKNQQNHEVLDLWFRRHLKSALECQRRPWEVVPRIGEHYHIDVIMSPDRAAAALDDIRLAGYPISFDYETDRLKPDHPKSRIVSCAVCSGGECTIAYPWQGAAIQATSRLLRSDLPKYGTNNKFEQRWTKAKLGHEVRNWKYDSMLGAHVLDNRRGITSAKFQGYVQLGVPTWDAHISDYLKGIGGNGPNQIDKIPIEDLLIYNGTDALVEYLLAIKHMKEIESDV